MLLLFLKELYHCHRFLSFLCSLILVFLLRRLTTRIQLFVNGLLFPLLLSCRIVQDCLLERNDWLPDLKLNTRCIIVLQVLQTLLKVNFTARR